MSPPEDWARVPGLVLIVDDDPDARAMIARALAQEGMLTAQAEDGASALAMLDSMVPDLVLLDAVMPAPDGFETCRRIKQRIEFATLPVIFMTGLSETEHVVEGLRAGGVDYITKPLVLDELVARLRVHLATARMTLSARNALDTAGRMLVAADNAGRILWSTPHAAQLLAERGVATGDIALMSLLRQMAGSAGTPVQIAGLEISAVGQLGPGEHLFRVSEPVQGREVDMLRAALDLTAREGEVLRWIAAGKANKDISEILDISPRTVNKHLEQIFIKLGVENRAAAASIATRVIASGS
jgi:DNA-binding response OmpR family regulator/DNA-binding CsgD family transcriptional regulator